MARWSRNKVALCFAVAIALVGCLGGQTSDPGNAVSGCLPQTVPAGEPVNGVSPAQLAQAFAGSYTATLKWMGGQAAQAASAGVSVPDDQVTVTVTYEGADGTNCLTLSVLIAIEITTRDSGIHETGAATLTAVPPSVDRASFFFSGNRVSVLADLVRSNGTLAMSGTLDSRAADLPGSSARFPAEDTASGGSGGAP